METYQSVYRQLLLVDLEPMLSNLSADQQSAWGRMTPQHMIEHLIVSVKLSYRQVLDNPPPLSEEQAQFKQLMINPNGVLPMNLKSVLLGDQLAQLKFDNLPLAKANLLGAVKQFYAVETANPELRPYLPMFGEMSMKELEIFHYKHFVHHLRQFGLL